MTERNQGAVTPLPEEEAAALARRAAEARGIPWPATASEVEGVGGLAADVTPHPGRERVVWATLPGQSGLLAVFADDRMVASVDRSLGAIAAVQVAALPGLPHGALVVDDRYDQMLGAFQRTRRRHIYVWDGRRLREVFRGTLLEEQLIHPQWSSPRAPRAWRLERKEGEVLLREGILEHRVRQATLEAPGGPAEEVPPRPSFQLVSVEDQVTRYRWNPRLRRFDRLSREAEEVGL